MHIVIQGLLKSPSSLPSSALSAPPLLCGAAALLLVPRFVRPSSSRWCRRCWVAPALASLGLLSSLSSERGVRHARSARRGSAASPCRRRRSDGENQRWLSLLVSFSFKKLAFVLFGSVLIAGEGWSPYLPLPLPPTPPPLGARPALPAVSPHRVCSAVGRPPVVRVCPRLSFLLLAASWGPRSHARRIELALRLSHRTAWGLVSGVLRIAKTPCVMIGSAPASEFGQIGSPPPTSVPAPRPGPEDRVTWATSEPGARGFRRMFEPQLARNT